MNDSKELRDIIGCLEGIADDVDAGAILSTSGGISFKADRPAVIDDIKDGCTTMKAGRYIEISLTADLALSIDMGGV